MAALALLTVRLQRRAATSSGHHDRAVGFAPTENLPLPATPNAAEFRACSRLHAIRQSSGASAMNATNPDGSVTVTVPLEITVRLASGAVHVGMTTSVGAALAAAGAGTGADALPAPARQSKVDADTTTVVVTTKPSSPATSLPCR